MLSLNKVSLRIREASILRGIDMQVNPGSIVALVGANGAGKSSLIRCIAGSESGYDGAIRFHNRLLADWEAVELAKMRAVLSQHTHMSFDLAVLEMVMFGRFPYRQEESEAISREIAYWCLQQVGMASFAQRFVLSLSGGEQQRVQFARVLAQLYSQTPEQAKLLLLDEPTASLDIAQKYQLLQSLKKMVQQFDLGVLMVIHDINLAAQYADQLVLLKQGKLIAQGSTRRMLTVKHIKQTFGMSVQIQSHPLSGKPQIVPLYGNPIDLIDNNHNQLIHGSL